MSKRILIPTDFNVESLNTLKKAIDSIVDTEIEIILMYSEYLSDSTIDLLFYSQLSKRKEMETPVFQEALNILENRYEKKIRKISIEFFHGISTAAFKNFVEGKKIDLIYLPKQYQLKPLKNGFDPIPLIKKSKFPYVEMSWENPVDNSQYHSLSFLFI
jgi:hypothetical protein